MASRSVKKWAVIRPDGVIDMRGTTGCRAIFDKRNQAVDHARFSGRKDRVVRCTVTFDTADAGCKECGAKEATNDN